MREKQILECLEFVLNIRLMMFVKPASLVYYRWFKVEKSSRVLIQFMILTKFQVRSNFTINTLCVSDIILYSGTKYIDYTISYNISVTSLFIFRSNRTRSRWRFAWKSNYQYCRGRIIRREYRSRFILQ